MILTLGCVLAGGMLGCAVGIVAGGMLTGSARRDMGTLASGLCVGAVAGASAGVVAGAVIAATIG